MRIASRLFSVSPRGIGLAVLAGLASLSAAEAAQTFVYVANFGSNNVSAYAVNGTTGALTAVAGSPFAGGGLIYGPTSVTVDPASKFALVANGGGSVSVYAINAATGALTEVAGSPFPGGSQPQSVIVDPTGKFVYVANLLSDNVSAYTLNAATGALTAVPGSPFAGGGSISGPISVTVDPTGKFAYVADYFSNNVLAYYDQRSHRSPHGGGRLDRRDWGIQPYNHNG